MNARKVRLDEFIGPHSCFLPLPTTALILLLRTKGKDRVPLAI